MTILKELLIGKIADLIVTLSEANPPINSFIITNDSMNATDLKHGVCPY